MTDDVHGNLAGFDLSGMWIDENDDTITNNLGVGSTLSFPATSGFVYTNDVAWQNMNVNVEPELTINNKPVGEVLKNISFLLKFMIEKYDLHECKELKELAELDQWTDKVEVEKIPEFLKDEDFKL